MDMEREKEVYILGLWECQGTILGDGDMSICGVYTNKLKLIEGYQSIMDGNVRWWPFSDSPDDAREPVIYRFRANEFTGELPEWHDYKLYFDVGKYEISIQEVREKVEIYNDGGFQVLCNFNFEGEPKFKVRYIGGSEEEIEDACVFPETDRIEGDFSDNYVKFVLPLLKSWYNDNKEILKQIWKTKKYIPIPNWLKKG